MYFSLKVQNKNCKYLCRHIDDKQALKRGILWFCSVIIFNGLVAEAPF